MKLRSKIFPTLLAAGGFAVLAAASGPASAVEPRDFWVSNTRELVQLCMTPADDPLRPQAANYCMAYLDGAVDYHDAITDRADLKRLICYPDTATLEQGVVQFIEWGQAHKGDEKLMAEPQVIGVVRALADKWPCE